MDANGNGRNYVRAKYSMCITLKAGSDMIMLMNAKVNFYVLNDTGNTEYKRFSENGHVLFNGYN